MNTRLLCCTCYALFNDSKNWWHVIIKRSNNTNEFQLKQKSAISPQAIT
jgi:hypothetical protein